ncbi:MAG TPA: SDR family NAD(P)-dependent oxidoreductase [Gemmatimonadaceae bacterium]|nr:SDR family NAD(P)-dependent oxidoreductase [Gemmatimonadaceae bacterium]
MHNVIVTGASRGLGLGITRALLASGYSVLAIARRETAELAALRHAVGPGKTGSVHFKSFDLTRVGEIPRLVKEIRSEFGSIYGLVNNAGIGTGGLLASMSNAKIEEIVGLNTVSPIILTKYVVRSMMADGGGRIVNVTSIVSFTGYSGLSVYSATKASLAGFTRSLAREVGQLGITVNAVAPGFVDTDMTGEIGEADRAKIARRSALRRLIGADDVAGAVEFLLGEKARNITGTTLTVDAGNTA